MTQVPPVGEDARVLRDAIRQASQGLVQRRELIESIVLAALAQENVLVVGPPGTGRSVAARRVARILGGKYFEYLLGRSADPIELFGPIERRAGASGFDDRTGMLADAEVAFLEEVFEVQTTMLNHLQWFLSERVFRRGAAELPCALKVCVGAATSLDESPALRSYDERFLVRAFVQPMSDAQLESLLSEGWSRKFDAPIVVGLPRFERLVAAVDAVEWPAEVRRALADLLRRIRAEGVEIADTRAVRAQRLIAARAVLEGRSVVTTSDIIDVTWVVRTLDGQRIAQKLAARPVTSTLRPPSSASIERPTVLETPAVSPEIQAKPGRPRAFTQTESYSPVEMRAMLASAGAPTARDEPSGAREAIATTAATDGEEAGKPTRSRPSLPPPSRRTMSTPPPSAGRAAMPVSYKRASIPPVARKSAPSKGDETRAFGAFEKRRPSKRPSSVPRAVVEEERSTTGERPARRRATGSESVRLELLTQDARGLLRTTMPDGGASLEDWRTKIESLLSDIDKLAAQGVSSDALRLLRGLLGDALDASWKKGVSSGTG